MLVEREGRFTFSGNTDKVYGDELRATVGSKLVPTEPYGTSKACADLIAQTYRQTYGMQVTVIRPSNIYGYDPCNDRIVPNTIKACLAGRSPVIFRNEESKRQYLYIEDFVEVMHDLTAMAMDEVEPIVNIASPTVLSQAEVVNSILQFFPHIKPTLQGKPTLKEIHSQSMGLYMHVESPTEFTEGIRRTIEAFRKYGGDGL
jgi:dTDP-D-glucose 4,6-dehydratase